MAGDSAIRACVYGAGAIGLDLAVALLDARAPCEVELALVARGPNGDALRGRGLEHRVPGGPSNLIPRTRYRCAEHPRALGPQDLVFVTTKSDAFAEVAAAIAPLLGSETVVVTAMNGLPPWFGLGQPELAARLGPAHQPALGAIEPGQIIGVVIHRNAAQIAPGVVERVAGTGLVLGRPDGRADDPRLARLTQLTVAHDYALEPTSDIYAAVWHKLLINATINPLSVVCGQTLDVMVSDAQLSLRLRELIAEVEALGVALGVAPGSFDVDGLFARFASQRRGAITSMLRDHQRGRPLELDRLVRAPLALAALASVGVPMPRLTALLAALDR